MSASRFNRWAARGLACAASLLPVAIAAQTAATPAPNPLREGLPLEPTRRMTYTATEGSWMSVDVSPDGSTIVFDHLGDLYTLPIAGGRATRLTQGMAVDVQPRFSPDGRRVAFVSDRSGNDNVWIMSLDRSDSVQVTKSKTEDVQSPEWTPDGKYLVVTRETDGPGKLWMYHVEGGGGLQLVRQPENLRTLGAAFGEDGRYIWFAQRTGNWQYNSAGRDYQLAVYDRETGERATRTFRYGGGFRPALSPDGKWLVYGTRHVAETALRVRNLESGEERWLAYPVQRDESESIASLDVLPGMSFTPDSRAVVVSYGGKIWRVPVDGSAAAEIPFQIDVDLPLGPKVEFDYPISDSSTFEVKQIRDAVPSPDGRRIAFTALDRLYVMDLPNGTPRRVTTGAGVEHHPAWSPDGRWLAYGTWSFDGGGHLWKIRPEGRSPQRLSSASALYQQPAWSPDGTRIVAVRGPARAFEEAIAQGVPGGATDLIWFPANGGEATTIAPVQGTQPHFVRRQPERIYLWGGGDDGLISIRWDGTDRRQHVKVTGARLPGADEPVDAGLVMMAPEGDQALAQVLNDLYVVTVPIIGGTVPTISVGNPEQAQVPVRKLTQVGGQFPAWGWNGNLIHWSIGNAHMVYDLARARAVQDSVEQARRAAPSVTPDSAGSDTASARREAESPAYRPMEVKVTIRAPRDVPQGVAVLRGARAITMRGDEVIENADVIVRDNRIEAVGARGSVQVPAGARVIDLTGKTIVPGFVDTHAHLRPSFGVHREQVWAYAANLAYGVTTTRDPQTGSTDVLTYGDMVTTGEVIGPRIYSTGPGVFGAEQVKSKAHAKEILRRYSDYYDTKTIKMYVAGNREQRQWIIDAARELRLMPTTEGGLDLQMDITMAQDAYSGQEHNTPGFPLYSDMARLYAEAGTAYTPTTLVSYGGPWGENFYYATENVFGDPKLRYFTPMEELQAKALRRPGPGPGQSGWFHPSLHVFQPVSEFAANIMRAGGQIGVGSHGQLQGLGYHWELWSMQTGGLTPHEALRVATLMGASAIGLDGDLGSIEPGKLADLVILDRNPLENIRNTNSVLSVMINGRLFDANTLNETYPRQRQAPAFYWLRDVEPRPAAGIPAAQR